MNRMASNLCFRMGVEAARQEPLLHPVPRVVQIHVVNGPWGASVNSFIGRQAHIAFLEDESCVRRLVTGLARGFMPVTLPESVV